MRHDREDALDRFYENYPMKNISFQLTMPQIRARTKTVTRRMGWLDLKAGDLLCGVEKGQGLKPGEKINRLCTIRVVHVRREKLSKMTDDLDYGRAECVREGFPEMMPAEFVAIFCASHKKCTPESDVTRIKFEYV